MKKHVSYSLAKKWEVLFTALKTKQAQLLTSWRAKDNHFKQAWKQRKSSHWPSEGPWTNIFSNLVNKTSPVTHSLERQGQPFSAGLKTRKAQSLTDWRAKGNHFQQAWKQSKFSHSPTREPRATIFSRLKNKESPALTSWRAKDNHFQKAWKQSKPSHSLSGEPRTTIFSRLENIASSVTHILESQGPLFSAGLKTKQAQSLTSWRAMDNHYQQAWKQRKPSHSQTGEPRTTIFSKLENKISPVTHSLEIQEEPCSASLEAKQAQSLTLWRANESKGQVSSVTLAMKCHEISATHILEIRAWSAQSI